MWPANHLSRGFDPRTIHREAAARTRLLALAEGTRAPRKEMKRDDDDDDDDDADDDDGDGDDGSDGTSVRGSEPRLCSCICARVGASPPALGGSEPRHRCYTFWVSFYRFITFYNFL